MNNQGNPPNNAGLSFGAWQHDPRHDCKRLSSEEIQKRQAYRDAIEAMSLAERKVFYFLVLLLKVYPKSNRGEYGRFRKPLSKIQYERELLVFIRGAYGFNSPEEIAATDHFIQIIDETEADALFSGGAA